jgi:hypothetical protein
MRGNSIHDGCCWLKLHLMTDCCMINWLLCTTSVICVVWNASGLTLRHQDLGRCRREPGRRPAHKKTPGGFTS